MRLSAFPARRGELMPSARCPALRLRGAWPRRLAWPPEYCIGKEAADGPGVGTAPGGVPARAGRRADVAAGLSPAELDTRIREGSLQALAGIGPATAEVITQAAEGRQPDYLTKL